MFRRGSLRVLEVIFLYCCRTWFMLLNLDQLRDMGTTSWDRLSRYACSVAVKLFSVAPISRNLFYFIIIICLKWSSMFSLVTAWRGDQWCGQDKAGMSYPSPSSVGPSPLFFSILILDIFFFLFTYLSFPCLFELVVVVSYLIRDSSCGAFLKPCYNFLLRTWVAILFCRYAN